MRLKILFLLGFASTIFAACSARNAQVRDDTLVQGKLLSFPSGFYQSIVYLDDRLIGFTFGDQLDPIKRVSYAYEGDVALHSFNPQNINECKDFIGYSIKGVLPDGRIGFLGCGEDTGSTLGMFTYNWQTGEVEPLIKGPLVQGYQPKSFTWNPEMTRGVQEMVSGAQGTIYWISPEGISPMDVKIEYQGLTWNLKDYYEGKEDVGLVLSPSWSPDGKTIAFFASTYGVREEPRLKASIKYELYFMDPSELMPVQVLKGMVNAVHIRWSPDGKYLLFSGCAGPMQRCGLWLYTLESKSLSLVAEGDFQDFIWVTDKKVVAIKNIALPYNDNEIWKYSIEQLLEP